MQDSLLIVDGFDKAKLVCGASFKNTPVIIENGNQSNNIAVLLSPAQVLQVRQWFDERVRQLIANGLLEEHKID